VRAIDIAPSRTDFLLRTGALTPIENRSRRNQAELRVGKTVGNDHNNLLHLLERECQGNPESLSPQFSERLIGGTVGQLCEPAHNPNHPLGILTAVALERSPDFGYFL
jgi:hypothetical protein